MDRGMSCMSFVVMEVVEAVEVVLNDFSFGIDEEKTEEDRGCIDVGTVSRDEERRSVVCADADLSVDGGESNRPGVDVVTSLPVVCISAIEGGEEEGLEGDVGQLGEDVTNGTERRGPMCAPTWVPYPV